MYRFYNEANLFKFSCFLVIFDYGSRDVMEGFQAFLDRFLVVIHATGSLRATQKTLGHRLV